MATELIGFCRFSFFGPSDTKLSYEDREAAFSTLYAAERMETRFTLFEHLFLPAIKAQSDPDFRLIVLSSACMPETYKARLCAVCADVPQIELLFAETENLASVLRPITKGVTGPLLQFRIDDDDALSKNYIARLRQWSDCMTDGMLVTLPKGLMLHNAEGMPALHPMYRNLTGAGLAYFSEGPTRKSILGVAHIQAGKRIPYISDPKMYSYIQSFTATSDTAFRAARKIPRFMANMGVDMRSAKAQQMVDAALEQDFPIFTRARLARIFERSEPALIAAE